MAVTTPGPLGALRSCWRPLGRRAARAYVAGPALGDALVAGRRAASRGFGMALGFWDGGEPPREVADTYARALDAMAAARLDGYLSIKAPALHFSRELLGEVLARSGRHGTRVHFDALRPETAAPTFALMASAGPPHPVALGCTLPARWHRSASDAEEALALGLSVRLVKGEEPGADGRDIEPRRGMLALVDQLAGRARHVAVATHDAPLAREALSRLRAAATPCEMELLLGLPLRRPVREARNLGVRVRLYVPYGHARLPYRLAEAGSRPAVLWWAARDVLQDGIRSFRPVQVFGKEAHRVRSS
jgi:proline dehydrogenase